MKNNYKVYVHVFPDGKRYVGYTCRKLQARWNGGLGYEHQKLVFSAIVKFGWNNIRHYVLMENLTKDEALLYESAFINSWKTYTKSKGYNTVAPIVTGANDINIPTFQSCEKRKIIDNYDENVLIRRNTRDSNRQNIKFNSAQRVRCLESGEVFANVYEAATMCGNGNEQNIYAAIKSGYASGTCLVYDDEIKCNREVPAHWEYVN